MCLRLSCLRLTWTLLKRRRACTCGRSKLRCSPSSPLQVLHCRICLVVLVFIGRTPGLFSEVKMYIVSLPSAAHNYRAIGDMFCQPPFGLKNPGVSSLSTPPIPTHPSGPLSRARLWAEEQAPTCTCKYSLPLPHQSLHCHRNRNRPISREEPRSTPG